MNNGQRRAGEEAAFVVQLMCFVFQRFIMVDFLIPQKCGLETLQNLLLIGALLENNASAGHSIERRLSLATLSRELLLGFTSFTGSET